MEHSKNFARKSEPGRTGGSGRVSVVYRHPLLQLQALVGNRTVQRLIDAHARAGQSTESAPGELVNEMLNTPGEPPDAETRGRMESSFGADFSGARVHTGSRAAESAKAVQSDAFTSGQDIVFAECRFNPGTEEGQRLLAHELTHVVQQSAGPAAGTPTADGSLSISHPDDAFEQHAAAQAEGLAEPGPTLPGAQPAGGKGAAPAVQRDHAGWSCGAAKKPDSPGTDLPEKQAENVASEPQGGELAERSERREESRQGGALPEPVRHALGSSPGEKLSDSVRADFGNKFGQDLSHVTVHRDPDAANAVSSIGANAFAYGGKLFFREGAFDMHSQEGRALLAHELAHVVQQTGGAAPMGGQPSISEKYARTASRHHLKGNSSLHAGPSAPLSLAADTGVSYEDDQAGVSVLAAPEDAADQSLDYQARADARRADAGVTDATTGALDEQALKIEGAVRAAVAAKSASKAPKPASKGAKPSAAAPTSSPDLRNASAAEIEAHKRAMLKAQMLSPDAKEREPLRRDIENTQQAADTRAAGDASKRKADVEHGIAVMRGNIKSLEQIVRGSNEDWKSTSSVVTGYSKLFGGAGEQMQDTDFQDANILLTKAAEALNKGDLAGAQALIQQSDNAYSELSTRASGYNRDIQKGEERSVENLNRVSGAAKAVGHTVEFAVGCPLAETGLGALACAHGSTSLYADLKQIVSGEPTMNITEKAIYSTAKGLGASDQKAQLYAMGGDALVGNLGAVAGLTDEAMNIARGEQLGAAALRNSMESTVADTSPIPQTSAAQQAPVNGFAGEGAVGTAGEGAEEAGAGAVGNQAVKPAAGASGQTAATTSENAALENQERELLDFKNMLKEEGGSGEINTGKPIKLFPYEAAGTVRQELGVSGKDYQAAHGLPSSVGRGIPGFDKQASLTTLEPTQVHSGMDAGWKADFQAMRRAGDTTATTQTIYDTLTSSLENSSLDEATKFSMKQRLQDEMFMEQRLALDDELPLPYPNIKPKPAGALVNQAAQPPESPFPQGTGEKFGDQVVPLPTTVPEAPTSVMPEASASGASEHSHPYTDEISWVDPEPEPPQAVTSVMPETPASDALEPYPYPYTPSRWGEPGDQETSDSVDPEQLQHVYVYRREI